MWLPKIAPLKLLLLSSILILAYWICQIALVSNTPWLGLDIDRFSDDNGLKIVNIHPSSPLLGKIEKGSVLTSISNGSQSENFKGEGILFDPALLRSTGDNELFLQQQQRIFDILTSPEIVLTTYDGKSITTATTTTRTFADTPARYWITFAMGSLAILMAVGAWSIKRSDIVIRAFGIGAFSYFIHCSIFSLHISRGIVVHPFLYTVLSPISQLAFLIFIHTALILIWHYPRRIMTFNIYPFLSVWVLSIWLITAFNLVDIPAGFILSYYIVFYGVFSYLAFLQWNASKSNLADKHRFFSLTLGVAISSLIFMALIMLPLYFMGRSLIPIYFMSYSAIFVFIGLSIGIAKTELFGIDNSWFQIWAWFISGVLFIGLDASLIFILDLQDTTALLFSVIFGVWVYYPIRQWILNHYLRSNFDIEDKFTRLLDMFFAEGKLEEQWIDLLHDTYKPLKISIRPSTGSGEVAIRNSGLQLEVPTVDGNRILEVNGRNRGNKLFSRSDKNVTQSMYFLVRKSAELTRAKTQAEEIERERIMRDLHDDVGSKLLTLTHRLKGKDAELARAAMKALRDSIYVMDRKSHLFVSDVLDELAIEIQERLMTTETKFLWDTNNLGRCPLSPRQAINLSRILQESTTNALKHASPSYLKFSFSFSGQEFIVDIINDGDISPPETWELGKGVHNIRKRTEELGGTVTFTHSAEANASDRREIRLRLSLPIGGNR